MTISMGPKPDDDTSKKQIAAKDDPAQQLARSQPDQKGDYSRGAYATRTQRLENRQLLNSDMGAFLKRAQDSASLGLRMLLEWRIEPGPAQRDLESVQQSVQPVLVEIMTDLAARPLIEPEGSITVWLARARAREEPKGEQPKEPRLAPSLLAEDSSLAELLAGATQNVFDPEALRIQTISELRERAATLTETVSYIENRLPDRLATLEQDGTLPRDRLADVAITALQVLPNNTRGLFGSLLPKIRGYLEHEPEEQRESNWLASIGALGDAVPRGEIILAADRRVTGYLLDAIYYNWLVSFILCRQKLSELSRSEQRLLGNNIHNLIVSSEFIIVHYENNPNHDPVRVRAVRERQHKLLAAGAGFRDELAQAPAGDAEALLAPFGWEAGQIPQESMHAFLASFEQMEVLINLPEDSPARVIFRTIAGVVRASNGNPTHTAVSFFNAGVNLLRIGTDGVIDTLAGVPAGRIILNTLGLCWTLELNPDPFTALGPNDGLDCAVNLFAALVDMGDDARRHAQLAEALYQAILQLNELRPGYMDQTDLARIRSSGQRLKLRQAALPDAEKRLQVAACDLLSNLTAAILRIEETWPEQSERRPGWTARVAAAALRLALGKDYEEAAHIAENAVTQFVKLKLEPENTLRDIYAEYLPSNGLAGAKRGILREVIFVHPLVAALGDTDISSDYDKATEMSIESCSSLAGAVREAVDLARELIRQRTAEVGTTRPRG